MKTSNSLGSQVKVWTSGAVTMAAGFEPLLIVKIKPGVSQIDFAILRSGLILPYI